MSYTEISYAVDGNIPLLGLLQLAPVFFMLLVIIFRHQTKLFWLGLLGSLCTLVLAIVLFFKFDSTSSAFQFAEQFSIVAAIQYHAAVDGIAVFFILLTTIITVLVVMYGRLVKLLPAWRFLAGVFALESAMVSQFVTVDMLWYCFSTTLHLILVTYLLYSWATSPNKSLALNRYLQFMSVSAILLLLGTLLLGWNYAAANEGRWSFDFFDIAGTPIAMPLQSIILFLVFYAFAIRIPLFPMHGWLITTARHGTVAVAPIFLLGIKAGVFGMMRYLLPLMPEAIMLWLPYLVGFAVVGIFYAAVLALIQVNMRNLLVYAVVSHSGLILVALFGLSQAGFQGALLLTANFSLAIVALFFILGLIYRHTGTVSLAKLGGLFDSLRLIGVAFLVGALAIIGMPGTLGFDALHLTLEASIHRFGGLLSILAALGNVAAAAFILRAFQKAFLTPSPKSLQLVEIEPKYLERTVAISLIFLIIGAGLYDEYWLNLVDKSVTGLASFYSDH